MIVFGDNDASGTAGQAAAWSLAKKSITSGIKVDVRIPRVIGQDWADVLKDVTFLTPLP